MEQYDRNLQLRMDDENKMQYKLEKRERRGEKRGVYKVAKNLKEYGASVELIMNSTGLTKEQVQQL